MINETIKEIKNYFLTNETKSYDFRLEQLKKFKTSILKYQKEIINALNYDLRKPEFESYTTEFGAILEEIDFAIKNLKDWMKEIEIDSPADLKPSKTVVLAEPYGVVLIIVPFNYPFRLAFLPLIGAIASGNCAVLKISKRVPYTIGVISKILSETFESRYIKLLSNDKINDDELLEADTDYVFFTGSTKTGAKVASRFAERLVPCTLELGGKSPVIIDGTVNLEIAAKRIVKAKFINCGQTCIAPDYVLIHSSVKQEFIEELKNAIRKFYGSIPQESQDYSRIIDTKALRRLDSLLKEESKNIIFGGLVDECGLYIEPTILDNITFDSLIMKEEIFGPVLPLIEWDNKEEIIETLSKKDKPLALYLFSKDDDFIKTVVKNLSFGGGCINDAMAQNNNINAPFGGVGLSGIGRYHGKYTFDTFSHLKTIFINKKDEILDMLYPPYNIEKLEFIKKRIGIN